ncbi:hypothetical protein DERP_002536 [Dermatophagoides pteronyssinus]|uniref:Uncharacterized protein n=2 Tax=Dermatophagoides pteronyssinus TaxID=6956 RepID=A0ABQ8JHZ5_DERPT|nr:protein ANTAGONIST OF LIKE HETEROCHROMATIN PROTEIN 1-like [Dermatophagoides pteronyssinus]KAH9422239.1 hypothetical protein DERP_002536 [Dermatophagoides pteronyssinus]
MSSSTTTPSTEIVTHQTMKVNQIRRRKKVLLSMLRQNSGLLYSSRRFGISPKFKLRDQEGEFAKLFPQLKANPDAFYDYLGMSEKTFMLILNGIQDKITRHSIRKPISPEEQLFACIRYLVQGVSHRVSEQQLRIAHQTISGIVARVCQAICDTFMEKYLSFPTVEEFKQIANRFWTTWNIPNCLGAIDGKHIRIKNSDNKHGIYMQAVTDADYRFICCDVGVYNGQSDKEFFSNSIFGQSVINQTIQVPTESMLPIIEPQIDLPYFFIGDDTYPLRTNLLRPYPERYINESQKIFNYRINQAKRVAEYSFGVLIDKFKCLNSTKFMPDNSDFIVLTCVLLYNMILTEEGFNYNQETFDSLRTTHIDSSQKPKTKINNPTFDAKRIRDIYAEYFFNATGSAVQSNSIVVIQQPSYTTTTTII